MDQYDGKMGTATTLLTHYLRTAWEASGMNWNEDNDTEVRLIVGAIAAEAVSQATKEKT